MAKQECLDAAKKYLAARAHSRAELGAKLVRRKFDKETVGLVLDELQRLAYVDDRKFAAAKARSAAERKHQGRRRVFVELRRAGVSAEVAEGALNDVYATTDSTAIARELAMKQAPRLRKLDPMVARRRLVGMLQRRGFDYEAIKGVVDEVLRGDA